MGRNLQPFWDELQRSEKHFRLLLSSGEGSADKVALARTEYDLLLEQITLWPDAVIKNYVEDTSADPETGYTGAALWRLHARRWANGHLFPHLADQEGRDMMKERFQEYLDLAFKIVQAPYLPPQRAEDNVTGIVYLVRWNQSLLVPAVQVIASELMDWFNHHPMSPAFLKKRAEDGWYQFLLERPDIMTLLRLIEDAPRDVTAYYDPDIIVKPPIEQAIFEMVIAFIPVIGTLVAAYEAYSGKDLFGNPLDVLDRSILAGSVLLPISGRLLRNGRAVYSETRLVALAGREAAEWERAIAAAGRVDADTMRVLGKAEAALRAQQRVGAGLAKEAAAALPHIAHPRGLLQSTVDKEISAVFQDLRQRYPIMETLDDFAIRRIVEKGPNVDHIKGQLLEELIESRLVPWLRQRTGAAALGFPSDKLVFIPGHMIRDAAGRQITDGVLGVWRQGELVIVGIFEAKAGRYAARELSLSSGSISKLTDAERAELRAMSIDVYNTEKALAERAGKKYTKTIEDIEKSVIKSERRGQVGRDIERLSEDADGNLAHLYIGDMPESVPVRISPTRTRFFGLIPKDAKRKTIENHLTEAGLSFEIIGVDMTSKQLKAAANKLEPLAKKLAGQAP